MGKEERRLKMMGVMMGRRRRRMEGDSGLGCKKTPTIS